VDGFDATQSFSVCGSGVLDKTVMKKPRTSRCSAELSRIRMSSSPGVSKTVVDGNYDVTTFFKNKKTEPMSVPRLKDRSQLEQKNANVSTAAECR